MFSAGGPGASLEAVARAAGVGIATLYRHFPTREALFQAVYAAEVDELVALAERGDDPPADALRAWLHGGLRMIATKKGMIEALAPAYDPAADFYADAGARMRGTLTALLERAVAAGAIRADVPAEDLFRVLVGLCASREAPDWQDRASRLLDIFADGLAPR